MPNPSEMLCRARRISSMLNAGSLRGRRTMLSYRRIISLVLTLLIGASVAWTKAQDHSTAKPVIQQDRVIAGSPNDSLEVRHLVLQGSNEAIGRTLAQLAMERYRVRPQPSQDPLRTRAQRRYFEKNYPILYDRMKGVASAFGR